MWVRPSGLDSQRSASHGSSSKVARFTRTRRAWVSSAQEVGGLGANGDAIEGARLGPDRGDQLATAPRSLATGASTARWRDSAGRKYHRPPTTSEAVIKAPTKREIRPI